MGRNYRSLDGIDRSLRVRERVQIGGGFNLDNQANDLTGWSTRGLFDDNQTGDLGSFDAAGDPVFSTTRIGGIMLPHAVSLERLGMVFDQSADNTGVTGWGWVLSWHTPIIGSSSYASTVVLNERKTGVSAGLDAAWAGTDGDLREYDGNNHRADIGLSGLPDNVVPAGSIINLAVGQIGTGSSNARYVYVHAGFLEVAPV